MKFAIIAAGEGSRLAEEGIDKPKPLVELCEETMIERLIRIFTNVGASEIVIIVNKLTNLVFEYLEKQSSEREAKGLCPIRILQKTTPSSMHSFYEISSLLEGEKFCLTTVDTIFREDEFSKYISHCENSEADGVMAVTSFIDDEKPLYVGTDSQMHITAFNDNNVGDKYISGGIYQLGPKSLATLRRCIDEGQSRMRNFQRALVADGLCLEAYPFTKIMDVDHASDIVKAEEFISKSSDL